MIPRTSIIKQKWSAGWKRVIKAGVGSRRGGAFSIILLGVAVSACTLLVFVNAADYALYSYKRSLISRGLDHAVSAAVQEVDYLRSEEGLSEGFDENTGMLKVDNIFIDEGAADNAFFSTLESNTGLNRSQMEGHTLITVVNPRTTGVDYIIKKQTQRAMGNLSEPVEIETLINAKLTEYWPSSDPQKDRYTIYVSENPGTNEFKKRPYYIAVIKDYEIDGLFRKRTATFVGFKGAKIERKE